MTEGTAGVAEASQMDDERSVRPSKASMAHRRAERALDLLKSPVRT
jgi:hypothetical protein